MIFKKCCRALVLNIAEWLRLLAVCLWISSELFADFLQITCGLLADYLWIYYCGLFACSFLNTHAIAGLNTVGKYISPESARISAREDFSTIQTN